MNKNYFIVMLALVCNFAMAQIQQTSYRGAFAPSPATMWTTGWTNFDPNNAVYGAVTTVITGDITANTTWVKTNVYELRGIVTVRNNATLTIPAGTVIRSNIAASCLVITRGAKLVANGTLAEPIVFTSANANGARNRGDWGGIVLLGKARYNINNGVNYIEGLSQNVNTEFGGGLSPIDGDSSGSLKYVRIEYAGFVFAPNNELNGLTMGAVGSGTTIDYVQVSYSNDDSFEWFGGSVNCSHLVAFAGLDDDFDTDNGYKGICQFGLGVRDPLGADISTSEGFESDNNAGATATAVAYGDFTSAIFTNYTMIGGNRRPNGASTFVAPNAFHDKGVRIRRASQLKVFNTLFVDFRNGLVINDALTQGYAGTTGELKFRNNTIVTTASVAASGASPTPSPATLISAWYSDAAKDNRTLTTNAGLLANQYNGTSDTNFKLLGEAVTATSTATGLIDYRPVSADALNAAFTDSSLSGLITLGTAPGVISTVPYCKGAVATVLTANLTATGVSLKWYSKPATFTLGAVVGTKDTFVVNADGTQTFTINGGADVQIPVIDTPLASAPTPVTTTVGTKYYWVSELDANGVESARAKIAVTTNAAPLLALAAITGPVDPITLIAAAPTTVVSTLIGTTTTATYTVAASVEPGIASYLWTVPLGVNIISQNLNTIVVNYANVPAGTLKVGNIAVQAVNAGGCPGALKTLAITAVLPAAPAAIKMTDVALPIPVSGIPTAVTSFAKYMGTTTPLVLTATPVAAAASYVWELPTGVNLLNLGAVTATTQQFFNSFPFTVALVNSSGVATRPTTAGNVYYEINRSTYANGTTITTGRIIRIARAATTGVGALPAITAFNNELTNLTNENVAVNPAYPITATTSNVIDVNFAGVNTGNTYNYLTTAAVPVATSRIRIGVKSRNGVGASITANAAALDPITSSTAKLLTLSATRPAAPAAIKMTDGVSTTAVTIISKFVGTPTVFTLTATPSVLASSYTWELPAGVNLVSGALSGSASNVITVNFAGVAPATTSIIVGVKGVNGIDSSVTTNVGNASTAKLLKLTAAVPAAVSVITGQIAGVCGGSSYSYTITPTLATTATSYDITAPTGSVVTSASNPGNLLETLNTTDLTFTVTYPAAFASTPVVGVGVKNLIVAARNGVGSSLNKTLALSTLVPALGAMTSTTGTITAFNQTLTAKVFTVPTNVIYTGYTWTANNGAVITAGQSTNSITVDFSGVLATAKPIITVVGTTPCGASAVKSTTLSFNAAAARIRQNVAVSATEVYPNPVSSKFNVDVTAANAGTVEVSVYSLDGTLIVSPKSIEVQEGANTVTENVSGLNSGIYILQIVNPSNGEVITKKLIKE